jgi:hypothetical protein
MSNYKGPKIAGDQYQDSDTGESRLAGEQYWQDRVHESPPDGPTGMPRDKDEAPTGMAESPPPPVPLPRPRPRKPSNVGEPPRMYFKAPPKG